MIARKARATIAWSLLYVGSFLLGNNAAEAFAVAPSSPGAVCANEGAAAERRDAFDTFVEMRTGLGSGNGASDRVFWTGEGTLFESPSGRVLAKFEGVDVCRGVRIGPGHVRQLSRKVFWFRDPETGKLMTEYEGKPVKPIKYEAQVFEYRRGVNADGEDPAMAPILSSVVRGPRIVPVKPCTARWASPDRKQMMFNIPIFIDIEVPGRGRYQAYEFYDYTAEPLFPADRPPSAVWSRQGSIQPFVSNGKAVMHSIGRRVTSFDELPDSIRTMVEKEYPLFCQPPTDIAEVDRLQEKAT